MKALLNAPLYIKLIILILVGLFIYFLVRIIMNIVENYQVKKIKRELKEAEIRLNLVNETDKFSIKLGDDVYLQDDTLNNNIKYARVSDFALLGHNTENTIIVIKFIYGEGENDYFWGITRDVKYSKECYLNESGQYKYILLHPTNEDEDYVLWCDKIDHIRILSEQEFVDEKILPINGGILKNTFVNSWNLQNKSARLNERIKLYLKNEQEVVDEIDDEDY